LGAGGDRRRRNAANGAEQQPEPGIYVIRIPGAIDRSQAAAAPAVSFLSALMHIKKGAAETTVDMNGTVFGPIQKNACAIDASRGGERTNPSDDATIDDNRAWACKQTIQGECHKIVVTEPCRNPVQISRNQVARESPACGLTVFACAYSPLIAKL
jgi:hypothetical protein